MKLKQLLLFIPFVLLFSSCVVNAGPNPGFWQPVYYGPGIGLGFIVAAIISWNRNHSILLALLCGLLGWLYVIYALLVPKR
jgi:hypothetical protein